MILIGGVIALLRVPLQTDLFSLFPPQLESLKQLQSLQKKSLSTQDIFLVFPDQGKWTDETVDQFKKSFLIKIASLPDFKPQQNRTLDPSEMARPIATAIAALPEDSFRRFATAFQEDSLQKRIQNQASQWQGVIDEERLMESSLDPLGLLQETPFADWFKKISTQPSARWIRLTATEKLDSFQKSQRVEQLLREQIDQTLQEQKWKANDHPVWLTGESMFNAQISSGMKRDIVIMLTFTIFLVVALFIFIYRSLIPLLGIFFVQLLVIFSALIVAALFLEGLNVITIGFASILIGISLDYCILVYHHFASGGTGKGAHWQVLVRGIWFSALSTGGAFGVLYFSSFPGLQQMAILVATGLIASAGFSTTLLAEILKIVKPQSVDHLQPYPPAWAGWIKKHHRLLLLGFFGGFLLIAMIIRFFPSQQALYNNDLSQLQPNHLEAYRAHAQLKQWGSRFSATEEPLEINRSHWNPETLKRLNHLAQGQMKIDGLTPLVIEQLDLWSQKKIALHGGSLGDYEWKALRKELDQTAVQDFKQLSVGMLLLMVLLTWLAHRSIGQTALNLIALLFGLILFGSLLFLLNVSLTLVSLICVPLLIGLIIDYTIHFLLGFEHEKRALPATFHHLLIPIATTGMTSLIGFTAPALSSQPALLNFGWVMDLGILSAMITVLIFLPALTVLLYSPKKKHYSQSLYSVKFFKIASSLAKIVPRSFARALARSIAVSYLLLNPSCRKIIQENQRLLGRCPWEQPSIWKLYGNFAAMLADYFYFGVRSINEQSNIVRNKIGYEHLAKAKAEGRGGFILTSHLSFFELGGMLLSQFDFKAVALSLPEPTTELTEWRTAFRRSWGIETIEVGTTAFSTFTILEALRRNEFVIALIDRPNATQTTSVSFPNGSVEFASGILSIAQATGSPVLIGLITESDHGYYDSVIYPPIEIGDPRNRQASLQKACDQIRDRLLPVLQKYPNQWFQFTSLQKKQ